MPAGGKVSPEVEAVNPVRIKANRKHNGHQKRRHERIFNIQTEMRQSQTYTRGKQGRIEIDPDSFETYQRAVALRIVRKTRGRVRGQDALQLAQVRAFFLWLFRKPRAFFKKRRMDRKIRRAVRRTNSGNH